MEDELELEVLKGRKLSADEIRSLEKQLSSDSSDTTVRARLLGYYFIAQYKSDENQDKYCEHALWFIENAPDWQISGTHFVKIRKCYLTKLNEKYLVAERMWNKHLAADPDNTSILDNAANFFINNDTTISIELYKKAIDLEPSSSIWHDRLAQVYSLVYDSLDDQDYLELAYQEQLKAFELYEDENISYQLELIAERAFSAGHHQEAEGYALRLLDNLDDGWLKDSCLHTAHTVLGLVCVAKDDVSKAVEHLVDSSRTERNPRPGGPALELANQIVKRGQIEPVREYLEYCKKYAKNNSIEKWISEIDQGKVPELD